MKAAQINSHGGPEVIEINEISKPDPAEGQVLVEVHAAALNPFDLFVLSGNRELQFPFTLGGDFAGVETESGDEVWGQGYNLGSGTGALAEFISVKREKVTPKPKNVNFEEAASLVLVGVSAMQALDLLNLSFGQKILIQGGAGGIGSAAIQYAKHLEAYVATTVRGKDADFVKQLGADEVIDFEKQKIEEVLSDYDAVFDVVRNGGVTEASYKILKSGGKIASMSNKDEALAAKFNNEFIEMNTTTDAKSLDKLRGLVEQGAIKPEIDKIFPLEQTAAAFKHLETGRPRGKVVVKIK